MFWRCRKSRVRLKLRIQWFPGLVFHDSEWLREYVLNVFYKLTKQLFVSRFMSVTVVYLIVFYLAISCRKHCRMVTRIIHAVHPKLKIMSSFTHAQILPNMCEFISSVEHKRYLEECGPWAPVQELLTQCKLTASCGLEWLIAFVSQQKSQHCLLLGPRLSCSLHIWFILCFQLCW